MLVNGFPNFFANFFRPKSTAFHTPPSPLLSSIRDALLRYSLSSIHDALFRNSLSSIRDTFFTSSVVKIVCHTFCKSLVKYP